MRNGTVSVAWTTMDVQDGEVHGNKDMESIEFSKDVCRSVLSDEGKNVYVSSRTTCRDGGESSASSNACILALLDAGCNLRCTLVSSTIAWKEKDGKRDLLVDPDGKEQSNEEAIARASFAFATGGDAERKTLRLTVAHHVGPVEDGELIRSMHVAKQTSEIYAKEMRKAVQAKMGS